MTTRDLVLISLFSAIIIALGLLPPITLGIIPVPITAQSLGVMLAGVVLGAKRGTLAVLLTILIAAIGLPVLSGGRGGLSIFTTPTTGYLIGFPSASSKRASPHSRKALAFSSPVSLVASSFFMPSASLISLSQPVSVSARRSSAPWPSFRVT